MINRILTAFRMCLSMFTCLPLPSCEWDEDLRRVSTAFLPAVGLVIGIMWWALAALTRWLLPEFLGAAAVAAFPFIITGFIHLDGFMDSGDALLSWRDRDEKLKILKDVHVGSFAVVLLVLLVLFQFASCMSIEKIFPLAMIPVLSRVGSALSVFTHQPLSHSEYAHDEEEKMPESLVRIEKYIAVGALLLMLVFSGWGGLLAGAAVLGGYALCMRWCVKVMGGVSGDLAGFCLTVSELCGLILLAIV